MIYLDAYPMSDKLEKHVTCYEPCRMFLMHQCWPVWQPGPTRVNTMASGGTHGFQARQGFTKRWLPPHSEPCHETVIPGCGGVFVDADGHIGPLPPGLADSLHIPVMEAGNSSFGFSGDSGESVVCSQLLSVWG